MFIIIAISEQESNKNSRKTRFVFETLLPYRKYSTHNIALLIGERSRSYILVYL